MKKHHKRFWNTIQLAAVVFLVLPCAFGQTTKSPPNIVIIIADDLGYNDLGAYGSKEILTPHIDELAREGVRLTNFYVTSSACTPSRSGLRACLSRIINRYYHYLG